MKTAHPSSIAELSTGLPLRGRIRGASEMADLIRTKDWSGTALGPIEDWSETLIASVNMMLLSPFSFALYWGDELTLLYNDVYRPFLYEKHPEALGGQGREVWREAWPVIGPPIETAISEGRATDASNAYIPILVDGVLEDRWWTYGFFPIFENERIAGVANFGADDTPSIKARQALQASEARAAQVLNATSDAIVTVNRKWELTYLNPRAEQMYGRSENLVGQNLWKMFPDAVYEGSPFSEHYNRAMNDGVPGSFEVHYPAPLDFTIALEVYPTPDGIVTFSRDVTKLRQATAAVLQNEKLAAVGRLASSIAHEINNPLEAVTNLLYLAKQSSQSAQTTEYLEVAERELRRVAIITNQTLSFSKQITARTVVSCLSLFTEALSIYQGRLLNSKIAIEKRKRAGRLAECMEGEIRQVLSNLMSNAIDAMHPDGGRLILRSRDATNWQTGDKGLALTVADTGTGMSPIVGGKIFEAFYSTKGIGGTGLGLWVSKEIVERHGGRLTMRSSQKLGASGTVFCLFLPLSAASRS